MRLAERDEGRAAVVDGPAQEDLACLREGGGAGPREAGADDLQFDAVVRFGGFLAHWEGPPGQWRRGGVGKLLGGYGTEEGGIGVEAGSGKN